MARKAALASARDSPASTSVRWLSVSAADASGALKSVSSTLKDVDGAKVARTVENIDRFTAALGAMVLAHRERMGEKPNQREWARRRFQRGEFVSGLPAPGVYARHNAVDTPALLPDGTPTELSVSRTLQARDQVARPGLFSAAEHDPHQEIEEGSAR